MAIEEEYKAEALEGVTRVEVIDNRGRAYTRWDVTDLKLSLQDDKRTLKVFVTYEEEEEIVID